MKKVLITYHMTNGEEDAETCVTLPMMDEIAADVLAQGEDSCYLGIGIGGAVWGELVRLAQMQGYHFTKVCKVQLAE